MLIKFIEVLKELKKDKNFRIWMLYKYQWDVEIKGTKVTMSNYEFIKYLKKNKFHFELLD